MLHEDYIAMVKLTKNGKHEYSVYWRLEIDGTYSSFVVKPDGLSYRSTLWNACNADDLASLISDIIKMNS